MRLWLNLCLDGRYHVVKQLRPPPPPPPSLGGTTTTKIHTQQQQQQQQQQNKNNNKKTNARKNKKTRDTSKQRNPYKNIKNKIKKGYIGYNHRWKVEFLVSLASSVEEWPVKTIRYDVWTSIQDIVGPATLWPYKTIRRLFWAKKHCSFPQIVCVRFWPCEWSPTGQTVRAWKILVSSALTQTSYTQFYFWNGWT